MTYVKIKTVHSANVYAAGATVTPSSSSSSSSPSPSSYDEKSDATRYFSVRWSIETLGFSLTTITIVIGQKLDKKDI
ncbi:hypothetical protein TorRG33x02_145110 [Trema orientale]|uniref:Uncharacterized protein n=1 Tax=Trema orientale TaxID=63057 RepID=A0A2P5EVW2_TREOI|nr:hypothetical protein TorRG33x02_145110 [Trema orientale]